MRVGLVIYGSLDTLSGGYLYDRQLVAHLRSQGDQVEILSLPWRSYPRHLLDNLRPAWRRRLAGLKVDILLQDELNHPSLAWANRALKAAPFPVVSVVHHLRAGEEHPAWLLPFYRRVEQRYLASVDAFVFNSQTTRQSVAELYPASFSLPPSVVAYPAGDHLPHPDAQAVQRLIDARRTPAGPTQILFVGNLIPRKGLHHLLAALARLPGEDWRLHAVGRVDVDPAYTARLRAEIRRRGLGERVLLHGRLPDRELAAHLRQAHLLAVPSYEGFGIVYLEAMAFGLPVLASTAGAAHEIVQPGVNGFLVEPAQTQPFADTLSGCLTDRAGLAEMGIAARRRFDSHPTWAESGAHIRRFLLDASTNPQGRDR